MKRSKTFKVKRSDGAEREEEVKKTAIKPAEKQLLATQPYRVVFNAPAGNHTLELKVVGETLYLCIAGNSVSLSKSQADSLRSVIYTFYRDGKLV